MREIHFSCRAGFRPFKGIEGGPEALIESLVEVVGEGGTLIMPAFNWGFSEEKFYSKRASKPVTGLLTCLFAEWPGSERIYHPMHGFTLVGKDAKELAENIKNLGSWESSSLFGELHRRNAKLMVLGVSYRHGFTFLHYVEEMVGVPYRKFMELSGKVEELDGTVHDWTIPFYGRSSLDVFYDFDRVIPYLDGPVRTVANIAKLGDGVVKVVEAQPAYDSLAQALRDDPNLLICDAWPE